MLPGKPVLPGERMHVGQLHVRVGVSRDLSQRLRVLRDRTVPVLAPGVRFGRGQERPQRRRCRIGRAHAGAPSRCRIGSSQRA